MRISQFFTMTEPVIARRCPTCGASIRDAAAFCPQCGNGLSAALGETQPLGTSQTEEVTPAGAATTLGDPAPPAVTEARKEPAVDSGKNSQKKNRQKRQKEGSVKDPAIESARASVGQAARGAVGANVARRFAISPALCWTRPDTIRACASCWLLPSYFCCL